MIKVTFALALMHIGLNLTLSKSENKLKLILNNINKYEGLEECRRLIQAGFEQNNIGPIQAFGLMLSMLSKILSIIGFLITITLYLCYITQ